MNRFLSSIFFLFISSASLLLSIASRTVNKNHHLEYRVFEELPPGTVVGNVKVDSHLSASFSDDVLSRLRFFVRNSIPSHRFFSIDPYLGVVRTTASIDRDFLCPYRTQCRIDLDVIVRPFDYFRIIRIVVHIVDLNDNSPAFVQDRITLSLPRTSPPGTLLRLPASDDLDSGSFGVQRYSLVAPTDRFELIVSDLFDGSKDVSLKVVHRLDTNDEVRYSMIVLALDGGSPPRSGSLVVEVIVQDSTENAALAFEVAFYETAVAENLPVGTTILRVRATAAAIERHPAMESVFKSLNYAFSDQTLHSHGSVFEIKNATGDVFLKESLDYEVRRSFQLVITAVYADHQKTKEEFDDLSTFTRLTVHVLDENDNSPEVTVNPGADCFNLEEVDCKQRVAQVRENSDAGQFVAHLSVRDADSDDNGKVVCVIRESSAFQLKALYKSEYMITTTARFDRELRSEYLVTVNCTDQGSVALTTLTEVRVTIADDNDNAPEIQGEPRDFVLDVMENNPEGLELIRLNASDRDSGKNGVLRFQLDALHGTPVDSAIIDAETGIVRANLRYDCEVRHKHLFLVTVTDQGERPLSTTVTLQLDIADDNDNAPQFDQPSYYFRVVENTWVGSVIGRVAAFDSDLSDEHNRVFYKSRTSNAPFQIDSSSGLMTTSAELDREEKSIYFLSLSAFNRLVPTSVSGELQETTVNVTIYVDDENDNVPSIVDKNKYNRALVISKDSALGTEVVKVEGWDSDIGANAILVYSIAEGNEREHFQMNATTGLLTTNVNNNTSLDSYYRLTVRVCDQGQPPLESSIQMTIEVTTSDQRMSSLMTGSGNIFNEVSLFILVGIVVGIVLVSICISASAVLIIRSKGRRNRNRKRIQCKDEDESGRVVLLRTASVAQDSTATPENHVTVEMYREMTKSLEMANAIYRSMELSRSSTLTMMQDGRLTRFDEDIFPNWTFNSENSSRMTCGSRSATGSLPRQNTTTTTTTTCNPHHSRHHYHDHHRRRRYGQATSKCCRHPECRCGSAAISIHHPPPESTSSTDDSTGRTADPACRHVRHWSWYLPPNSTSDDSAGSITGSSCYADSGQGPSVEDDHIRGSSHRSAAAVVAAAAGEIEGRGQDGKPKDGAEMY